MHSPFCDTHGMADVERARRLREARKKAPFPSASAAAASMGIKYATYVAHENGSRAFDNDAAQLYSRKFKVRLEWLLTGRGERDAELIIPEDLEQKLLKKSEKARYRIYIAFHGILDAWPDEDKGDEPSASETPEDSHERGGGAAGSVRKTRGGQTLHSPRKIIL
jgi:hypothetical protein